MKKFLALTVAGICLSAGAFFTGCKKGEGDYKKIEEKKYFVCGITGYEPMNYFNEDGDLVGFDTEFAKAVAEDLGLTVKFQVIDWSAKYLELSSGAIDCIWNGFTFGSEDDGTSRTEYVDFSYPYLNNSQCVVVKTANLGQYTSLASLSGKSGEAEGGSAGADVAKKNTENYTDATSQTKALLDLKKNACDFIVVDILMAQAYVGKGDYADLSIATEIELDSEVYAIGFRKGSDFTEKVNGSMKKLSENGTLEKIAEKYGLTSSLIPNIGK